MKHFAETAAQLHVNTTKTGTFVWNRELQAALKEHKIKLLVPPELMDLDLQGPSF